MQPIETISGQVSHLDRADVDTDQIMPKQFLKRVERTGFGEFLFYDWAKEPGWDLPANPILVAGENFGCGSSREHAPWGLQDYGFQAIVAPSFARHLLLQLHQDRAAAGRARPMRTAGRSQRAGRRPGRSARTGGPLRRAARSPSRSTTRSATACSAGLDDIALTLQQSEEIADLRERARAQRSRDHGAVGGEPVRTWHTTSSTLPGDGIGPEIMAPTLELLEALGDFEFEEHLFGGASIDAHGMALTDEVLAACRRSDAVLLAAVGGPKWDTTDPDKPRPEQGLLGLRKGLGLYANLRPVKPLPALYDASPLRRERIEGTDLLVVRELTGGIYFGEKTRTADSASDLCAYTTAEIERIARTAFTRPAEIVEPKVSSVDKANVLETSRLWREVVSEPARARVPATSSSSTCSWTTPPCSSSHRRSDFDTILTENMFGDILSDEAAMITGSIGMLPSASLGDRATHPGHVRAGARLGAGHRRTGRRKPAGDVPLGGDDAAARAWLGKRGGGCRIGRGARARRGPAHARPGRRSGDGAGDEGSARQPRIGVRSTWSPPTSSG